MARVFISYSRKDQDFVAHLAHDLDQHGAEVWRDKADIRAGEKWSKAIQQGLDECEVMILVLSPDSMGSTNVADEWQYYLDNGKALIPVLLRPAKVHFQISRIQYIDFNGQDYDAAFAQLLDELAKKGVAVSGRNTPPAQVTVSDVAPTPQSATTRTAVRDVLPPPFEWCTIPEGYVTIRGFGPSNVPAFYIAKYPITNAQYAKFIEADGYQDEQWWTEAGWQKRANKNWTEPRWWKNTHWNGVNHPVVGVSWYEAVAFCHWLSAVLDADVMLPTEQQWQRAAQGDEGWKYPWGNSWDGKRCNHGIGITKTVKVLGVGRTTPVQEYEGKGDSSFGVVDMAGNVAEWCLNKYSGDIALEGTGGREVRGGSWNNNDKSSFHAAERLWNIPGLRGNNLGFRCVCSLNSERRG